MRIPTGHPIYEHARVCHFKALLEAPDLANDAAAAAKVEIAAAAAGDGGSEGGGGGGAAGDSPVPHGQVEGGGGGGKEEGDKKKKPPPQTPLGGPLELLGELMFQSHASYTACGLGSDGTSRLVDLVREHAAAARAAGRPPALYGAKITGGGSGGAVCVMGLAGAAGEAAVAEVAARYARETGHVPAVFAGSSDGAARLGALRVRRRGWGGGGGEAASAVAREPALATV